MTGFPQSMQETLMEFQLPALPIMGKWGVNQQVQSNSPVKFPN